MAENPQLQQLVTDLIGAGRQHEAIARVSESAEQGDDWAALSLARWKLAGKGIDWDLTGAVNLLEGAADRGDSAAAMELVPLYATGTGCEPDQGKAVAMAERLERHGGYIAAQLAFLRQHPDEPETSRQIRAHDPAVTVFRQVLKPEECAWIRTLAKPHLRQSLVEEPGTGRRIPHPVRTSEGMSFAPTAEDLVINRINRRIARLSETEYGWGEPLHVLRYTPGQQYRPHFDALPGIGNQRQLTAIVYCNGDYEGGETRFPAMDLTVRGEEGDMVLFENLDAHGRKHPGSEHAGLPVTSGEKWVATRWIRQKRYHPWDEASGR